MKRKKKKYDNVFIRNHIKRNIVIKPTDIFLVGYPRTGTTWLRYLIANYYNPEKKWNLNNLPEVCPAIQVKEEIEKANSDFRVIKSHYFYQEEYPKVIYIKRDIEDICISYFHASKSIWNYTKSFMQFREDFYAGKVWPGRYIDHLESWKKHKNILFVNYETLNLEFSFIVEFIGWPLFSQRVSNTFKRCSKKNLARDHKKRFKNLNWTGQTPKAIKEKIRNKYKF